MFTAGVKGASVNVDLAICDVVSDLDGALRFIQMGLMARGAIGVVTNT